MPAEGAVARLRHDHCRFLKLRTEAQRVLQIEIEWGRYGEVYEYDFHTGRLKLPDQAEE
jgi:hypothetical protein